MRISYPPEPFHIKMVESIRRLGRSERLAALKATSFNVCGPRSDDIVFDLLTDSGAGAMGNQQWSAIMLGDETYAGARSLRV